MVGCWRGYLSGVRCRFPYGSADATATHCLLLQKKSRLVLPFWYRFTRVVPDKGPLNRCVGGCKTELNQVNQPRAVDPAHQLIASFSTPTVPATADSVPTMHCCLGVLPSPWCCPAQTQKSLSEWFLNGTSAHHKVA